MTAPQPKTVPVPAGDGAREHIRRLLDVEPRARRFAILPVLITALAIAIAAPLSWAMWHVYMEGALDPRRHGAGLCRQDGAGSRREHRRFAGPRQSVCA